MDRFCEGFPVSRVAREQETSLAGLGVPQHREDLRNRLPDLLGLGRRVDAVGKAAPRHRPNHHAGHREGQPEQAQGLNNPVSKSVNHALPRVESSAHASGQ